jgi:hypothetical protein
MKVIKYYCDICFTEVKSETSPNRVYLEVVDSSGQKGYIEDSSCICTACSTYIGEGIAERRAKHQYYKNKKK